MLSFRWIAGALYFEDEVEFDDNTSFKYYSDDELSEIINSDNENNLSENTCSDDNNNSEDIFENSSLPHSSFDGEFGPYFSSSTSASVFAWITKHMICK